MVAIDHMTHSDCGQVRKDKAAAAAVGAAWELVTAATTWRMTGSRSRGSRPIPVGHLFMQVSTCRARKLDNHRWNGGRGAGAQHAVTVGHAQMVA